VSDQCFILYTCKLGVRSMFYSIYL